MSDSRPWYREPETFIAVAALVVSISAVAVGLYEAALQRRHDRAEVYPRLELQVYVTPEGGSISAVNGGIGPALVKSVTITLDGKPQRDWPTTLAAFLGKVPPRYDNNTIVDFAIRAGEKVTLVAITADELPHDFWNQVQRIGVRICYASVFDEYWIVDAPKLSGGRPTWRSVTSCPEQVAGTDF